MDMYAYRSRPRIPIRHRVVYVREKSFEDLNDTNWRFRWPFLISTLIGLALIVFSLVIFSLEIASLAQSTAIVGYNGATYGRTASTGAGIWCGFFIFIAGVLILIIDCARHIRRWATTAFLATLLAAACAIILIGLDAKAVQDGRDLSTVHQILTGSSYFQPKYRILAAQLAFACLIFLFCVVFILLYIVVFISTPRVKRPPNQPGIRRPMPRY